MTDYKYGQHPGIYDRDHLLPEWREFCTWLYLPVVMAHSDVILLPPSLEFMRNTIEGIVWAEGVNDGHYVYVTAKRGFATPGNPLNRPGWHADGFGSDDINYIWADQWPTRFAVGQFDDISKDHVESAHQFEQQIRLSAMRGDNKIRVMDGDANTIYRLDPSVIHCTPIIPDPGGMRSFFKVSVSPNKYNLDGNSHNHLFDYNWRMYSREELRNDPAWAGGDSAPQQES
jgi:hypothetical protein